MEEVRQLVQEEGREARNLVAFHVAVDTPSRTARVPPRPPPARRAPRAGPGRLRSASAGRDKRGELRARYWALLFGDLQRAIGEIYNTVEAHENLNECQEVILVLENYMRDFKALGEWFRLKWEYDNTPPPQRPQSLAWEIRKTDFVRPESRRTYSVKSSPSVSGKNSPCLSGHNTPSGKHSPNLTGKASPSGKISPRISSGLSSSSPKANIEFFSSKIATSKIAEKPEPEEPQKLPEITEKKINEHKEIKGETAINIREKDVITNDTTKEYRKETVEEKVAKTLQVVEIGKAKELQNVSPKPVVLKTTKYGKLGEAKSKEKKEPCSQAKATIDKLEAMENDFLAKHLQINEAKNENLLNKDKENEAIENEKIVTNDANISVDNSIVKSGNDSGADTSKNNSSKSEKTNKINDTSEVSEEKGKVETKVGVHAVHKVKSGNNDTKKELGSDAKNTQIDHLDIKDIDSKKELESKKTETSIKNIVESKANPKPAYSQAAAKPKPVTQSKADIKATSRSTTPLARSKTVIEIKPAPPPRAPKQFPKRNTASKCSYPFNLTTGRTSLFDTSTSNIVSKPAALKKPLNKNVQMGSGDAKTNVTKLESKTRPLKPTSLKVNEKGDEKDKVDPKLEKIKDCDEYSSTDTIVTQINMYSIESSDRLRTLSSDEMRILDDVTTSVEVLNVDNSKNDNEGWLTVKSRRLSRESKKQSKSHWANRYHQPSATTSLPTLNMLESPKQETKPVHTPSNDKVERAKSEQPQKEDIPERAVNVQPQKEDIPEKAVNVRPQKEHIPEKAVNVVEKPKNEPRSKDTSMIRQKSDVTGLKTRSSRGKALSKRSEKAKDASKRSESSELTTNRLHSSLESLTMGLARSQESTEDSFDFDKWKAEFKTTFEYLDEDDQIPNDNEILKSADPSEMSEIAEMTSQIEENEKKLGWALDFQSEVDQRKLCEEEDLLNRQIMELQQVSDVELDTETDDTETDAEVVSEEHPMPVVASDQLGALAASLENRYETALAGMSWAERVDTLVVLEALVARDPGRAQQLHAKLSQGIKRRGSLQDALRRLQAKQARAERQRMDYQTERAKKIHQLLARVEEVKLAKNQLIEEKRMRMEKRLQKAAENRDQHLKDIVRKAHDEEEKLREIAFIKQLEAEHRRHDFLAQCRAHTARLRQVRRDRLDKLEQKAAREAAVGARREALEAARRLRVASLLERRRLRDARVSHLHLVRQRERDTAAREKAEGVKSRLSALAAAAELEARALRSRIRHKQDASQLRLDAHLQAIREKATGPRQPTTSESHDQNTKVTEEAEKIEQERRERDKQKAIKKKARKVKQKLLSAVDDVILFDDHHSSIDVFLNPISNKINKVLNQINHIITPLLETENVDVKNNEKNVPNDDTGKNNKKNKNKNNIHNDAVNGDVEHSENNSDNKKKNKRSKKSQEKTAVHGEISITENDTHKLPDTPKVVDETVAIEKEEPSKTENTHKKKKKNKNKEQNDSNNRNNNEKPKMSKASSVCSSLSDMSKSSNRVEKRMKVTIDVQYLERHLNELHRMMERLDKTVPDKMMYYILQSVKVLGKLLAVAAEREDVAAQFTTKALTTAVTTVSLFGALCGGARLLVGPLPAHLATLLRDQLDKDLSSEPREAELARQLTDCLSVCLDSAVRRERGRGAARAQPDGAAAVVRGRAHTLISYLCLCGCFSRADTASEVRESIQALLTVCADICQPSDVDVGSERLSAAQSLRCALGRELCGARAEFCVLFARGAGLAECGGFVRAARTAHLLRALAELDHAIVQESFGEGGWPLEFRAAVARLLSQHAPTDREAPRSAALQMSNQRLDQALSETMVLDLIVLVGFVVVNNPQLQETICDGWSVIRTLCTLPANWLVSPTHSHALLPTLVALADRPPVAAVMSAELSMKMLDDYMMSPEAQKIKLVQVIKQGRAKRGSGKK